MTNDTNPATKADITRLEASIVELGRRVEAMGTVLERKIEAMGSELYRRLTSAIDAKVHLVNQGIDEVLRRLFEIDDRLTKKNNEQDKKMETLEAMLR